MPPTLQKTRGGAPKLSEQAKLLVVPQDIVSTMWPSVLKTCVEKLGADFDPWQDGAGRVIFAKREDGNLAAMIDGVGMSLPRQVGKTHLIGFTVFALCVNMPGLLVIWTAHHSATTGETFLSMQGFAQRAKVAAHIKKVYTGSGDEEIRFHNGSRILFGAREHGFGRGIPGVDVLIFDEAQILSDKAMANMVATMNTSLFGLQLYIGTPPKPEDAGRSESFKRMRREALAGTLVDGAWIEFGADADAKDDDRAQWRKMNPSYPKRTPQQSLMRLKRKLTPADWRREGMGIWDDDQAGSRAISEKQWEATAVESAPDGLRSYAVSFSLDGSDVALAGATKHDDGVHVEHVRSLDEDIDIERGLTNLADWFCEKDPEGVLRWRKSSGIALSGRAGAPALAQLLRDRHVPDRWIFLPSTRDYVAACSMWLEGVRGETVTHKREGQDVLDASISITDVDKRGGLLATTADGDETPTESVALAHWVSRTSKLRRKPVTERKAKFL